MRILGQHSSLEQALAPNAALLCVASELDANQQAATTNFPNDGALERLQPLKKLSAADSCALSETFYYVGLGARIAYYECSSRKLLL